MEYLGTVTFDSIDAIYEKNDSVRSELMNTVATLSDEDAGLVPEGEKWSIANICEHLSLVEGGISRICDKLLAKAEEAGSPSDGTIVISTDFRERGDVIDRTKVDAPDRVKPSGEKTLQESLSAMASAREGFGGLKARFKSVDCNAPKFPHPFFGDLSAAEWLALVGAHEMRHLGQIRRHIEKLKM
jgi:uncharacterized damage-inducible protein DinB